MEHYNEVNKLAIEYRGKIINEVVNLERLMDIYIAKYYCGDDWKKIEEMMVLFLSNERMSFAGKQEIFTILLKKTNPETLKNHPELLSNFEEIKKHRNILAHYMVDMDEEKYSKEKSEIQLLKFKNKLDRIVYTKEFIQELWEKILKTASIIHKSLNPN